MKIYRETIGSRKFKGDLIYSNATLNDWINIVERAMKKAISKNGIASFFPHSTSAFSVQVNSGKKYRFQLVRK